MPQLLLAVDLHAVQRYFDLLDAYDRTVEEWQDRQGELDGEGNRDRALDYGGLESAHWRQIGTMSKMIERLEERLGLTPLVRAKLGLAVAGMTEVAGKNGPLDAPVRQDRS
jgi:hypothetical protein